MMLTLTTSSFSLLSPSIMILTSLGLSFLAPLVMGQTVIDIAVGLGGRLTFEPPYVTAQLNDIVNFVFHPKNHSVQQSTFDQPCVAAPGSFGTGFVSVPSEVTGLPNKALVVTTLDPQWFYCQQTGHCGKGMVFAINPPSSGHTFDAFQALAIAQNGTNATTPATNATSPSVSASNIVVNVGKDGQLRYDPQNVTAKVGDTIEFLFNPKNHTVTRSDFGSPCQPLVDTSANDTRAFDSGFVPVTPNDTQPHSFSINVHDSKPIWVYCRQGNHCQQGMVFAVNADPNSNRSFADFQALALQSNGTSSTSSSSTSSGSSPTPGSYGSSQSTSSGNLPSTSPSASPSASSPGAKGALDNAVVPDSVDLSNLTRNTYIIIGLLAAVLVGLVALVCFMIFRGNKGYKAVPTASRAAPDILPYTQKGPYTTPYSTADAEEYRD